MFASKAYKLPPEETMRILGISGSWNPSLFKRSSDNGNSQGNDVVGQFRGRGLGNGGVIGNGNLKKFEVPIEADSFAFSTSKISTEEPSQVQAQPAPFITRILEPPALPPLSALPVINSVISTGPAIPVKADIPEEPVHPQETTTIPDESTDPQPAVIEPSNIPLPPPSVSIINGNQRVPVTDGKDAIQSQPSPTPNLGFPIAISAVITFIIFLSIFFFMYRRQRNKPKSETEDSECPSIPSKPISSSLDKPGPLPPSPLGKIPPINATLTKPASKFTSSPLKNSFRPLSDVLEEDEVISEGEDENSNSKTVSFLSNNSDE